MLDGEVGEEYFMGRIGISRVRVVFFGLVRMEKGGRLVC